MGPTHDNRVVTTLATGKSCKSSSRCYSAFVRIVMKPLLFAVCVVFAFGGVSAQQTTWQPSPGHTQVQIWPGAVPDAQTVAGPEVAKTTVNGFLAARRPGLGVCN